MTEEIKAPSAKDVLVAAGQDVLNNEIAGKKWYASKTVWANLVAIITIIAQSKFGYAMPVEYQALALSGINLALRKITNSEITW